jgi:hypothetical protein
MVGPVEVRPERHPKYAPTQRSTHISSPGVRIVLDKCRICFLERDKTRPHYNDHDNNISRLR